jgi:hypothetical protein
MVYLYVKIHISVNKWPFIDKKKLSLSLSLETTYLDESEGSRRMLALPLHFELHPTVKDL